MTAATTVRPRAVGRPEHGRLRRRPVVAVLGTVLVLCAPLPAPDVAGAGGAGPADAVSAVLVAWCAVRLLRGHAGTLTPVAALLLGAPAVAFAVATAASADPSASLPGFVRNLQIFVLVPAAVLLALRDARDFRLVCGALVVLALLQGAVGVHQYVTGTGASYMGQDIRAVGTFGAQDVMGMSTVVSYALVAAFALGLAPAGGVSRRLRRAALGCAAVLVVPLALSFSRGAWIATAAACAVVLLMTGLRRAVAVLSALAVAVTVLVGGLGVGSAQIAERFSSISDVSSDPDQSVTDRYSLWDAALGMWAENPMTGVGPKNFATHRDAHAPLALSSGSDTAGAGQGFRREPLLSPHNMYLLVLSEQGLLGLTAVAGGWAALLVRGARRFRDARHAARPDAAACCGPVAVGLLVWQCVNFLYSDIGGPSTVLTSVTLGMSAWWAVRRIPAETDRAACR